LENINKKIIFLEKIFFGYKNNYENGKKILYKVERKELDVNIIITQR
jgi:hypothetical protein